MKRKASKGDRVQCTVDSGAGHKTEQPGKVLEVHGKGALVRMENGGRRRFVYWSDLARDTPPVTATPSGSFATVGDAARVKAPKHFEPKPPPPVPGDSHIGQFIRRVRTERGLSQSEFAPMIDVSIVKLSGIENGKAAPSDDELLAIAECFDIELELLLGRREPASTQADQPIAPDPTPTAAPPGLPPSPRAAPPTTRAVADQFCDFMEALEDVVPVPADREKRKRWMGIARSLFDLKEVSGQ